MTIALTMSGLNNLARRAHFMYTDEFQKFLNKYLIDLAIEYDSQHAIGQPNISGQLVDQKAFDLNQIFEDCRPNRHAAGYDYDYDHDEGKLRSLFKYYVVQKIPTIMMAAPQVEAIVLVMHNKYISGAVIQALNDEPPRMKIEAAAGISPNDEADPKNTYLRSGDNQELFELLLDRFGNRFIAFRNYWVKNFDECVFIVDKIVQQIAGNYRLINDDFHHLDMVNHVVWSEYLQENQKIKRLLIVHMNY